MSGQLHALADLPARETTPGILKHRRLDGPQSCSRCSGKEKTVRNLNLVVQSTPHQCNNWAVSLKHHIQLAHRMQCTPLCSDILDLATGFTQICGHITGTVTTGPT